MTHLIKKIPRYPGSIFFNVNISLDFCGCKRNVFKVWGCWLDKIRHKIVKFSVPRVQGDVFIQFVLFCSTVNNSKVFSLQLYTNVRIKLIPYILLYVLLYWVVQYISKSCIPWRSHIFIVPDSRNAPHSQHNLSNAHTETNTYAIIAVLTSLAITPWFCNG